MMRLFTENITAKLFSILIAFLLWAALVDEPELIETVTVPVEYRNLANHLDLSPDAPNRIQLQVRGPRGRLNEVSPDRTNIVLDLSGMSDASSRTFTIQADSINLPPTVSLVRAMPSQLRVKLERRLAKDVPVAPVFEDSLPASLKSLPLTISPANIRIVGPESRILLIESIPTEPISRADLDAAKPIRLNVLLADPELSIVGSPAVTLTFPTNPLP
ncbi:MAG: YbbR-like domain-containing protein [Acidobacteriota bacterium]